MLLNANLKFNFVVNLCLCSKLLRNSLFVLNNFQDRIDFSVNIVKLFDFTEVKEEFQVLVDSTS